MSPESWGASLPTASGLGGDIEKLISYYFSELFSYDVLYSKKKSIDYYHIVGFI